MELVAKSRLEDRNRSTYLGRPRHIDKTGESPFCRLCGEKGESVNHIVCECKQAGPKGYKQRHDNVAKLVHWKLSEKYHLAKKDKWYEHAPDSVSENDEVKLLSDVNIQCDHVIEARRPDIAVVNKQDKKCTIIDIAVAADKRIGEKENEKVEKYQDLKREIERMGNMRTVQVVPIVVGSLGSVKKNLDKRLGKSNVKISVSLLPKTTLLGTARILRKVLEL